MYVVSSLEHGSSKQLHGHLISDLNRLSNSFKSNSLCPFAAWLIFYSSQNEYFSFLMYYCVIFYLFFCTFCSKVNFMELYMIYIIRKLYFCQLISHDFANISQNYTFFCNIVRVSTDILDPHT